MNKLLIIEDDEATRRLTAEVLRFEGFEVAEAENGQVGVTMARTDTPQLIICDIMMPVLDGFGVLQALREDPRTALIPFIFLTAKAAHQDLRHGMQEGADDYITKPFQADTLIASVRRRLEKRSRQLAENQRRTEEVSLAIAASIPAEILEPLERIATIVNLVALKHAADDPQIIPMQEAVMQETQRLRQTTRRLHLYSQLPQLYANRFALSPERVSAANEESIRHTAGEICRRWKRQDDLTIEVEPADIPMGEGYLDVIVAELVDNACKFSSAATPIRISAVQQEGLWTLSVTDRGSGLEPQQISRIHAFKQFWTGNKRPKGLGLGLSLVQGIARLHGSEFVLNSDHAGTTVSILVPTINQEG